jgi:hypothetical protein
MLNFLEKLRENIFSDKSALSKTRFTKSETKVANKRKLEIIEKDQQGNYDIDGVSYDGNRVNVASDGNIPVPHTEDYTESINH